MRKTLIFISINVIGFFIAYVLSPQCTPCIGDQYCPPCIGKEEGIVLIALLVFDIYFVMKYWVLKKKNKS
ncbi:MULTISPECIES: hypothetical protein [Aquimarina]|uniref:Uncharacterized protein n=1 Tax=Aquimarina algiphila TaxID=2047982 RepID=A0A554VG31_9FLAO|nr:MULTISPECIES: hypothetical protein [Aquimarina]TSE06333.1 hypothetical protein FOF46_19425 [Aquimarina algiphila]